MQFFDITACCSSQVMFFFVFCFQNFQVSFYLFANKLENQKDKTNLSIFILPNMSFKALNVFVDRFEDIYILI